MKVPYVLTKNVWEIDMITDIYAVIMAESEILAEEIAKKKFNLSDKDFKGNREYFEILSPIKKENSSLYLY